MATYHEDMEGVSDYESGSDEYDSYDEDDEVEEPSSPPRPASPPPQSPPKSKKRKLIDIDSNTHQPKKRHTVASSSGSKSHPERHTEIEKHKPRRDKPVKNNIHRLGKAIVVMPDDKMKAMVRAYGTEDVSLIQEALVQIIGKSVKIYEDEHEIMLAHKKTICAMLGLTQNLQERKCQPTVAGVKRILLKPENHRFLLTLGEVMARM